MSAIPDSQSVEQLIIQKLPSLIQQNPVLKESIRKLLENDFAGRQETEDKFYYLLNELQKEREERSRQWTKYMEEQSRQWKEYTGEQNRKWEEQNRKWEKQNRKWDEQNRKLKESNEEQNRKWDEQNRKLKESNEEQNRKWEEQNRKWDKNQQVIDQILESIQSLNRKYDQSLGALGTRWGLHSEESFRNALAGILEEIPGGMKVIHVNEFDDAGEVFGRPDQVELDLLVHNGLLLIAEIKSSMSRADMYLFERKARFYERKHQRVANKLIVISPMVDKWAQRVADKLGITVYSHTDEVKFM